MEDLTVKEALEKYPYLKEFQENTIFTTKSDIEYIKSGEKILIDGTFIYKEFLRRIFTDDKYYDYAYRYLKGNIDSFSLGYIAYGDIVDQIRYSKRQIIQGLSIVLLRDEEQLNSECFDKYENLKKEASYKSLLEKYKNFKYDINIDSEEYSFNACDLIRFISLKDDDFERACKSSKINGVKKEHFIYGALSFFKENNIIDEYLLSRSTLRHYDDIISNKKVDIETINQYLKTEDAYVDKVILNKDLRDSILNGMPDDLSDLEKAIYIYIKMCKLLRYDEEYYAVNQKGVATFKHKDINYVSNVTPLNNEVVCFEFNLIYSKMLDEIGIKFKTDYKNMTGDAYGLSHANLTFRCDKFLIKADSVTSILNSDMTLAKLNKPLRGLECINKNNLTQNEFENSLNKVYEMISEKEKQIDDVDADYEKTVFMLIDEYSKLTDNVKEVPLEEKMTILIEKVNSTNLSGMDLISYLLRLKKILFNRFQRQNNVNITIVRNNETQDDGTISTATIIVLNPTGFEDKSNTYYFFVPGEGLISTTKGEIQSRFDDGMLQYISEDGPLIPGITVGRVK
ncbi:MAG: hypothetical protein IKF01_01785 [Bacilli bacterium]|nr:hypothetical protein [Bacilli bacterium]